MREDELHHQQSPDNAPLAPTSLPPNLAEFLRDHDYACLTHPTDQGTALVIKAPRHEILSVEGVVHILFRHEVYECPTAPVIRMLTTIYDQPDRPLALETFINVEDPEQRADYESLTRQEQLLLLFYDEHLEHRLTKTVGGLDRALIAEVLARADQLYQVLPEGQFSFEIAKAAVIARTTL